MYEQYRPAFVDHVIFLFVCRSLATVQLPLKSVNDGAAALPPVDINSIDRALTRMDMEIKKSGRLTRADIDGVIADIQYQSNY